MFRHCAYAALYCSLIASMPFTDCQAISTLQKEDIINILPQLEDIIISGMKAAEVPGLAIAIVYEDALLFSKGYGVRQVGTDLPVDSSTRFQLASISKPLTSSVLAALVGEGKITWDTKIVDLNPSFRLSDPWITAELTIADLLSHRSGLPDHAGDLLEDLGFDRSVIMQRLRFITALGAFRNTYAYTNFGFSEAAYAAADHENLTWQKLAKQLIFDPLDMQSSSFTFDDYWLSNNKAIIHQIKDGKAQSLYTRNPDAQSPAGGASSTADDFAKWMIMILSNGKYHDKQVIEQKALQSSQMPVAISGFDPEKNEIAFYGMGWSIKWDPEGRKVVSHNGGFGLGARTYMVMIPKDKVGIAVFTNSAWQGLPETVIDSFYDLIYKRPIPDDLLTMWNERWASLGVPEKVKPAIEYLSVALPLKVYLGKYHNDYYGEIEIIETNNTLELIIGPKNMHFALTHSNRDVFLFETTGENAIGTAELTFTIDASGKVKSVFIDYLNAYGNGNFLPVKTPS